jgi:hypothetical protein
VEIRRGIDQQVTSCKLEGIVVSSKGRQIIANDTK